MSLAKGRFQITVEVVTGEDSDIRVFDLSEYENIAVMLKHIVLFSIRLRSGMNE